MRHAYFCWCVLLLTQCGQRKSRDPQPEAQLPAATQTGANTFGCLVNGEPWTPKGSNGTSNFSVVVNPSYAEGWLSVVAYRYGTTADDKQTIGINSDSLGSIGTYTLRTGGKHRAGIIDRKKGCEYFSMDSGTYCKGSFTLTRVDLAAGVISGTFAFTLHKPGCDSIRVTNGRFDKRL